MSSNTTKKETAEVLKIGGWVLYLLSLLPLLLLAFYDHPSADDINMGFAAHEAFLRTGNPLAAIGEGLRMAWVDYCHWMGYFTSTALMSVPPSVFGEGAYPAGPLILLAAFSGATAFFLRQLLTGIAGMDKASAMTVAAATLLISVQSLPAGMARVEAFYWYCSGANYILTYCLGLCFLALMILCSASDRRKRLLTALCCLLGFLTGGGNYMTALSVTIVSVITCIVLWIRGRKIPMQCLPTAFLLAGFAASCLAPGNQTREAIVEGFGAVKSILLSLYYVMDLCIWQWTRFEHLILLLFLAPVFWHAAGRSPLTFRYPLPVVVLAYGLAAANVTPPLYALANLDAGRLKALFYLQYVLLLVLTEGYLIGWLRNRVLGFTGNRETPRWFFPTLAMAFAALSLLSARVDRDYYTAGEAIRELADGTASAYREENRERLAILTDDTQAEVVLKSYANRPALLFYSDLSEDPEDWKCIGMARYYHKKSVQLLLEESQ